jgi:methionyl-tRNA formyltransferase
MKAPADRLVVCAVGLKGAVFLERLIGQGHAPGHIVSYRQSDDRSGGFERIRASATGAGISFEGTRHPRFTDGDLVFIVGWQYLMPQKQAATLVVFHDSLLPKYRGFAPTVAALIKGERSIGVTALLPTANADEGPILAQAETAISYPIKIAEAIERQAELMCGLAVEVADRWRRNALEPREQDHRAASYSLWRDDQDYIIDWTRSAGEIARMVDATGFPYAGARTTHAGTKIIVDEAIPFDDLNFAIRAPGKVWRIDIGRPVVVCGSGLLRLDVCRTSSGAPFSVRVLRTRLG